MNLRKKRENYKKFEPLHKYAHDISVRMLAKIEQRQKGDFTDGDKASDLYRVSENALGYAVYIERRAIRFGEASKSVLWNDDYTNKNYMISADLTDSNMIHYVSLGQLKMPEFFEGTTGSGTILNRLTGFYTHFMRFGNVLSENFMPQDLWPLADEFAKANDRLIEIYPEDLLRTKFEEVRNITSITKAKSPQRSN
jgi:hypothetical protein